ncbi:reticulon-4-interacting protein 1 homolog, mitochondrial isoform X2 [Bicyclus anynana]|nr:reticulon-4-interacting protein 1 homolog, mitochondrial isoform X2 [Bicyclus anynana]XP_052741912.1 reticulon-4-interacting protein 1 homolog, mitochondrial isoform X2 [Bicyclus anynana]
MGAARMAAWRVHAYGARAELRLDRARVPALRDPRDVLVRVRAASLNPLDVAMIGGYGARVLNVLRAASGADEFPLVAGRDFSGEVVRAGAAARLRPGAAVWGVVPPHRAGAHAQYVLVDERWAGPAPRALSALQAGGALYAALTACAALRAAGLRPGAPARGERVLLLGLGGVGQAALQLLARAGAEVVAGCSAELRPRAEALGAALVLDRAAADYARALEECGPYGAILDCAGLGGAEAGARRWRFGRYVTLSSPLLRHTDAGGMALGALRAGAELAAQCAAAGRDGCAPRVRWAFFAPRESDIETLRRLAERGQFTVAVERVFGWWEAERAYERMAQGHARGKLLLDFTARRPAAVDATAAAHDATVAARV